MLPYGSWPSPLAASGVAAGSRRLGDVVCDGADVYWTEGRPDEAGRSALVRWRAGAGVEELLAAPSSVRTRVHEYGGGAFTVDAGRVWYAEFSDQRWYRRDLDGGVAPITPGDGRRFADAAPDPLRQRLLAVCEDPRAEGEPEAAIVALPSDGLAEPEVLVQGADFYASPRPAPAGDRLAWLAWDHPNMPWDGSGLWLADLGPDGRPGPARQLAGGPDESIFQPGWSPTGDLVFASDAGGWWNLRRWRGGELETVCEREADFGTPQWVFGLRTWAFAGADRIVCTWCEAGRWRLGRLAPDAGRLEPFDLPFTWFGNVHAGPDWALVAAGSPTEPVSLVRLDLRDGSHEVVRAMDAQRPDPAWVSLPEAIAFDTSDGERAHAFLYPPRNPECEGPTSERPPLLVKSHGGPTAASPAVYDPRVQFWTSRGFALLDVNYRGSSGYGRRYRDALRERWGEADVADCEAGARAAVARGAADAERLAISGGSAGGYTTLCALTFGDTFRAGASHYGISDLEALARDTHKFESRYLDRLVGPLPERRDRYLARSPLHHVERLDCPMIFFQGLEDRVVLPDQAEAMVAALRAKGVPVAYLPFEGEQHGFRRADNIARALEAELAFYGRVFGFTPADPIPEIPLR